MKKRTLKRFGAVLCAFAICLFSVFGVSSLFFKKDNNVISASAEDLPEYTYYMYFSFSDSSTANSYYLGSIDKIIASYGDGNYFFSFQVLVDGHLFCSVGRHLVNLNTLGDSSLPYYGFWFYSSNFSSSSGDYFLHLGVKPGTRNYLMPLVYNNYLSVLSFNSEGLVSFPFDGNNVYFSNAELSVFSGTVNDDDPAFITSVFSIPSGTSLTLNILRKSRYIVDGGYTQEDLNNARESGYNNGYALGQLFGKAEGEIIGQNNAGVNSSELFAGVKANLYVRSGEDLISSGLNVDVSQVVDEFYPNLPLWQFQITDGVISKDSTSTYVLELILPIYVKYPINTLYLGAGENATGVLGRVTGVSGYLYPQKENYDGGVVTAPLPAGFESFYNIKSVSFANPSTEDYYLSSVMISFTANPVRDSSFLLTLTTQELLNDYINTFNESYSTGEKVGYGEGKTVGYNEGVQDAHTYTFLNLMVAVIDAPIKSFTGMLDFEILGMNMQAFFLSLLTSALVLAAYRLFSGGKA